MTSDRAARNIPIDDVSGVEFQLFETTDSRRASQST